jgi:hypothetical protein
VGENRYLENCATDKVPVFDQNRDSKGRKGLKTPDLPVTKLPC